MAKKSGKSKSGNGAAPERGQKSAAIRAYLQANRNAKPKEIMEALKAQGIEVSPNMVSIVKAKAGIKKAKRNAQAATASKDSTAAAQTTRSNGLEAALLLYKAAKGQEVQPKQVTAAFLSLVELLS
jgi:arginine repressor